MTHTIGRFAPSPTGPLHPGSLVAALGSFLSARARQGRWLLRMEDVDTPRCRMEHASTILHQLEQLGFVWDGPVIWQSRRQQAYLAAIEQLRTQVYVCTCSRKLLDSQGGTEHYPGTCRERSLSQTGRHSLRVKVPDTTICVVDRLLGRQCLDLSSHGGDFVIRRADGVFAYQLAVVVDDAASGVTEVVRGADLLDSTVRQRHLQTLLGYPTPEYLHLPLVVDRQGQKLSKQQKAEPIDTRQPLPALQLALARLGQPVNPDIDSVAGFWSWAQANWNEARIPRTPQLCGDSVSDSILR